MILIINLIDNKGQPIGKRGPVDPTSNVFYRFASTLFLESKKIFTDEYFHIGGDEVPYNCWRSNPKITSYMNMHNITGKYERLEALHHKKLMSVMKGSIKPIVWQEVFDRVGELHDSAVVQLWTGNWREEMATITREGYPAILSTCWYLDHIAGGGDWVKFYECDPFDFEETVEGQKELVMGGEACMWGEFVDRLVFHPFTLDVRLSPPPPATPNALKIYTVCPTLHPLPRVIEYRE
jgi:hexosaminidase